jgi:hypothetical protein
MPNPATAITPLSMRKFQLVIEKASRLAGGRATYLRI